jgi:hypothetical protein
VTRQEWRAIFWWCVLAAYAFVAAILVGCKAGWFR